MSAKEVSRLENFPTGVHYAIVTIASVHIEGDQRSRDAPGHGYPAHTDYYVNYVSYTDQREWEAVVRSMTLRGERFRAFKATPAEINTSVSVKTE